MQPSQPFGSAQPAQIPQQQAQDHDDEGDQSWMRLWGWLGQSGEVLGQAAAQRLTGTGFHDLRELIWQILRAQSRRRLAYHVCCTLPHGEYPVRGRSWLLSLALMQVARHAARRCPPGGLLHLEALRSDEQVLFSIRVCGADEQPTDHGADLQLARTLLSAHGGSLRVSNPGPNERTWTAALPRPRPRPLRHAS